MIQQQQRGENNTKTYTAPETEQGHARAHGPHGTAEDGRCRGPGRGSEGGETQRRKHSNGASERART